METRQKNGFDVKLTHRRILVLGKLEPSSASTYWVSEISPNRKRGSSELSTGSTRGVGTLLLLLLLAMDLLLKKARRLLFQFRAPKKAAALDFREISPAHHAPSMCMCYQIFSISYGENKVSRRYVSLGTCCAYPCFQFPQN